MPRMRCRLPEIATYAVNLADNPEQDILDSEPSGSGNTVGLSRTSAAAGCSSSSRRALDSIIDHLRSAFKSKLQDNGAASEKNGEALPQDVDGLLDIYRHLGEVSAETTNAGGGARSDRGEGADLATHSEPSEAALAAAAAAAAAAVASAATSSTSSSSSSSTTSATAAALDAIRGASPQGASTTTAASAAATPRPPRGRRRAQNHNGIDAPQVKTERLTPDNNSTSSRSVTPSSSGHPGTPPSATSLGGTEAPSGGNAPPHHLKHMEQMMGRNYSDFMRSLAAKYNNSNPNDTNLGSYFGSSRNGYGGGLDPRFPGFKTAAATPFVGLMAPLGGASVAHQAPQIPTVAAKEPKDPKQLQQSAQEPMAPGLFGSPAANLFPPMLDMSSTQALLHMVRTANAAQSAAELESYLKGANKREASLSSPLDLSSPSGFAPRKRARTSEARRPGSISPKPGSNTSTASSGSKLSPPPALLSAGLPIPSPTATPVTPPTTTSNPLLATATSTPRTASPPPVRCPSLCGHMPCGDGQAVNRWSVEDVATYVSSIDICAEYAQNFREHRIDGASLPLLSEEHLTGPIGMKLGPALKLRVLLARKLGACTVCLHCAHCHQSPMAGLSAAAAMAAAAAQSAHHQQTPHRRASASAN